VNERGGTNQMTDDLVKRLQDKYASPQDAAEAAERIKELEKEVEEWKQRCLSMFVETIALLGDTAAEKSNIRAIFENAEELFTGENK
jgi:lipase chaperone LimK